VGNLIVLSINMRNRRYVTTASWQSLLSPPLLLHWNSKTGLINSTFEDNITMSRKFGFLRAKNKFSVFSIWKLSINWILNYKTDMQTTDSWKSFLSPPFRFPPLASLKFKNKFPSISLRIRLQYTYLNIGCWGSKKAGLETVSSFWVELEGC
jgi:hypothetical protein